MKKVVVTGGSGKAGRVVVRELLECGYDVLNVDNALPLEPLGVFRQVDLTDMGQVVEAMQGADAVVQLAAIPNPDRFTPGVIFQNNTMITYNVFTAAALLKMEKVVWASSETVLGLPFDREQPAYAPIDEQHPPYPETSYALSKLVAETMAEQVNRWSGIPFLGLRISNIKVPEQYQDFPSYWKDARLRKWNLWGYVDARDVAQACRLGLEKDIQGAEIHIIAAADTVMNRPSRELMAEVFPQVGLRKDIAEFETLLSIDKASEQLGYHPKYSWRDHL